MVYIDSFRTEREKTNDVVASYREAGMWVPASHCPGCGRFARTEAGNDTWPDAYWMVTDCAKCGRWEVRGAPLSWMYRGRDITVKKLEEA